MSKLPQTMTIVVENSDTQLYHGQGKAVTCFNDKGQFDILPYHANFITLIKEKVIVREENGTAKEFKIGQGVLRVVDNNVNIYVGLN